MERDRRLVIPLTQTEYATFRALAYLLRVSMPELVRRAVLYDPRLQTILDRHCKARPSPPPDP